MRVAVVSHAATVDVNQRVYRALEHRGHELTLVVPRRWRHDFAQTEIHPTRLSGFQGRILRARVARAGDIPRHFYVERLRERLRQCRPDVLYVEEDSYTIPALQWVLAARSLRIPAVFYAAQRLPKHYALPVRLAERAVWTASAGALPITEASDAALRARGFSGRSWIVPLATDVDAFCPGDADMRLRGRLGLRRQVVAYLGRLTPEKGIEVLLRGYQSIAERPDTSLLLIGDGPLRARCEAVDGVVVAAVAHSEVPTYLRLADVVALPTLMNTHVSEQFGRAAIEALCVGVPVVGSDSGELPHLLQTVGGGVVVPHGNPDALQRALTRVLQDPSWRDRAVAARSVVRDKFSIDAVAAVLEQALGEAAEMPPEESCTTRGTVTSRRDHPHGAGAACSDPAVPTA